MTTVEKRALYNLLRMHWLADPTLQVEHWQVEDYRILPLPTLFDRLAQFSIRLDKTAFTAFADECESPEDLSEHLIGDKSLSSEEEDQVYLIVFELWRRLATEKPCLSIFCNELDYYIHLFDSGQLETLVPLQDAINNFLSVLNENVDAGIDPKDALEGISAYCANDIETFFYDFISEQIDSENESYAQDLLESFASFMAGNKWFALLRARLMNQTNPKSALRLFSQLIEDHADEGDLEFNLELITFIHSDIPAELFESLALKTIPQIQIEEDFQDLLMVCIDYFHRLGFENQAVQLEQILKMPSTNKLESIFDPEDPRLAVFVQIIRTIND